MPSYFLGYNCSLYFTCLGRGLFIPFFSFYPKRADWKNYAKAGRYEIVTNSHWVSQTYIFPWVFPFSDGLEKKFWNCARNSCQNRNQEILSKGSWLVREARCHNDVKWCDLPSFLLAKEVMTQWWGNMMRWSPFLIGWGALQVTHFDHLLDGT